MEFRPKVILNAVVVILITIYLALLKGFNRILLSSRRSADNDIVWAIESMLNPDFWMYFVIGVLVAAGIGYLLYWDLIQLKEAMNPSWGDIDTASVIVICIVLVLKVVMLVALFALIVNPIIRILIIGIFMLAILAGALG